MKILQACAYAAPYEGNFMKSLYALEMHMNKCGYETIYALPETIKHNKWVQELTARCKVYFLPVKKARIHPKTYFEFLRIFRENKDIQIAHSHFELYDIPITITSPRSVKLFWHLHDPIDTTRKGAHSLLEKIQYRFLSKRATLLSVAEKYKNDLIKIGFPEKQAFTLLNGIDLNRIKQKISDADEFDFLAYVWDFSRKGCDLIIDASKMLIDRGYTFKVLLIGNLDTIKYLDKNFQEYKQLFIVQKADDDINNLFIKSKTFISASRAETFSYAVCEAAYAGLNVISSDIPGLEWAKKLPTVDFFESENVSMLCDKMENSLNGKRYNQEDFSITRNEIEKSFSTENWLKQICKYYDI